MEALHQRFIIEITRSSAHHIRLEMKHLMAHQDFPRFSIPASRALDRALSPRASRLRKRLGGFPARGLGMKHVPALKRRHSEVEEAVSNKRTTNHCVRDRAGELIATVTQIFKRLYSLKRSSRSSKKLPKRISSKPEDC
jgi:hypothetical protein